MTRLIEDREAGTVRVETGPEPTFVIVFPYEADPIVIGPSEHARQFAATLNDEWRALLLHAIESMEDTWP